MLDFGWTELVLILAIAVFVIGPEEIPSVLKNIGRLFRKLQSLKSEFSHQIDELMIEDDIEEFRKKNNDKIMHQYPLTKEERAKIDEEIDRVKELENNGKERS